MYTCVCVYIYIYVERSVCITMYLIKQRIRAHLFVNFTLYKYLRIIIINVLSLATYTIQYKLNTVFLLNIRSLISHDKMIVYSL